MFIMEELLSHFALDSMTALEPLVHTRQQIPWRMETGIFIFVSPGLLAYTSWSVISTQHTFGDGMPVLLWEEDLINYGVNGQVNEVSHPRAFTL